MEWQFQVIQSRFLTSESLPTSPIFKAIQTMIMDHEVKQNDNQSTYIGLTTD